MLTKAAHFVILEEWLHALTVLNNTV